MEENVKESGGQSDQSGGEDQKKNDTVAYHSYQKALDENKAAKVRAAEAEAKAKEMADQLEEIRLSKMQAEGKKDDVIKELQGKVAELSKTVKQKDDVYSWTLVESRLKEEAIKSGCKNPDHFVKLLDKSELATIKVTDNFKVDLDSIKGVVERSKGHMEYLFGNPAPKVHQVTPSREASIEEKDLSKMSLDELKKAYVEQGKR